MKIRNGVLIIGALAFLILVVSLSLLLADRFQVSTCGCPKVISQNFVYLFIVIRILMGVGLICAITALI
jgi:hypothetical protein